MKVRRYRDGRLVSARRLRRATLESARNLVLQRIGGMLVHVDRFGLMLEALRADGQQAAATDATETQAAGCCAADIEPGAEPDTQDSAQHWGSQAGMQSAQAGNPPTLKEHHEL